MSLYSWEMDYPELLVSPKASKRLLIETKLEDKNGFKNFAPFMTSSLTLTGAGIMLLSDKKEETSNSLTYLPLIVGLGSSVYFYYMSSKYRPYRKAYLRNKKMPYKTRENQLSKERFAEEEIEQLASFGKKLKWISVTTNLISSIIVASNSKKDSDAKAVAFISNVLALSPLVFPLRWELVAKEQRKYKKRIYGPIKVSHLIIDPVHNVVGSGFVLNTTF